MHQNFFNYSPLRDESWDFIFLQIEMSWKATWTTVILQTLYKKILYFFPVWVTVLLIKQASILSTGDPSKYQNLNTFLDLFNH